MIRVRYFARLREIAGCGEEERAHAATVEALFEGLVQSYPDLAPLRGHLRAAVNQEFVEWDTALHPGDEVVFIPPVSGGAPRRCVVTQAPLVLDDVVALVARPDAGAIATFVGSVRDHTGSRDVTRLEYEAYVPMAEKVLAQVVARAESQWPVRVAVHHRHGVLHVGELAVVIAVSSAHRAEAFEACRFVIEELKRDVPIWKKEVSADGESWIGRGP